MLSKKSKIEQFAKSRENRFLAASAPANPGRTCTKLDFGRFRRRERPFDRGPVDRYAASGFVVTAPYVFKFSVFSYVKNENDLLALAEKTVDAVSVRHE
jgi:hypothetical protein